MGPHVLMQRQMKNYGDRLKLERQKTQLTDIREEAMQLLTIIIVLLFYQLSKEIGLILSLLSNMMLAEGRMRPTAPPYSAAVFSSNMHSLKVT